MTIHHTSLSALHAQLRDGSLSATALMHDCAERYSRYEPVLHAYKQWNGEAAQQQAGAIDTLLKQGIDLGPLMGIPCSVKDLYGVPNMPVFAGTSHALPAQWQQAGPVIQSLLSQLAPITGKTHTVEFAFGGIGTNAHWGTPINPWSVQGEHRIPGGSSSGAGVSLVQGSALVALGTDTAGSVRIPASFTGTAGLKLSAKLWPNQHIVPLSPTLDTPGILARSVEDLAFAFRAMDSRITGNHDAIPTLHSLQGLRIGVPEHFFWDDVSADIEQLIRQTLTTLESLGATLVPVQIPYCTEVYDIFKVGGLGAPELSALLHNHLPEWINRLDPMVQMRVEAASTMTSNEYLRRCSVLQAGAEAVKPLFTTVDVVMTPTIAIAPPTIDAMRDTDTYRHANLLTLRNTSIANLLDLCAISMPVGADSLGLPVGLQLMCANRQERRLLAIGRAIEKELGNGQQLLGTPSL